MEIIPACLVAKSERPGGIRASLRVQRMFCLTLAGSRFCWIRLSRRWSTGRPERIRISVVNKENRLLPSDGRRTGGKAAETSGPWKPQGRQVVPPPWEEETCDLVTLLKTNQLIKREKPKIAQPFIVITLEPIKQECDSLT